MSIQIQLSQEIGFVKDVLVCDCKTLIGKLDRVLKELEQERPSINDLGELQSMSTIFDAKCARLATLIRTLEWVLQDKG